MALPPAWVCFLVQVTALSFLYLGRKESWHGSEGVKFLCWAPARGAFRSACSGGIVGMMLLWAGARPLHL